MSMLKLCPIFAFFKFIWTNFMWPNGSIFSFVTLFCLKNIFPLMNKLNFHLYLLPKCLIISWKRLNCFIRKKEKDRKKKRVGESIPGAGSSMCKDPMEGVWQAWKAGRLEQRVGRKEENRERVGKSQHHRPLWATLRRLDLYFKSNRNH